MFELGISSTKPDEHAKKKRCGCGVPEGGMAVVGWFCTPEADGPCLEAASSTLIKRFF